MIMLKNISVSFDERLVLDKFSFTFPKKGVVLITGTSGSGKTTLTRVILGLTTPNSGEVDTGGAEISVVFQEDRLVPSLTALKNVELVSNRASAQERLSQMGLTDTDNLYPSELSGGMKRRVSIARALAFGGDVLLLDEAFAGVDDTLAKRIIAEICKEYKDKLIIAVTHRPDLFSAVPYTVCAL